jgi:hypothetical protein
LGGAQQYSGKSIIDPVSVIDSTPADYVVYVQASGKWIRVVRKEDKQLVFAGSLPEQYLGTYLQYIRKLLLKLTASR